MKYFLPRDDGKVDTHVSYKEMEEVDEE